MKKRHMKEPFFQLLTTWKIDLVKLDLMSLDFKLKWENTYAACWSTIIKEIFSIFSRYQLIFNFSLFRKQLADASGVGCFSINDHIRSQIDYSSAYKMCAEDLRGWKERVPGLPYSHIFFLAVYGQLVCYRLKYMSAI